MTSMLVMLLSKPFGGSSGISCGAASLQAAGCRLIIRYSAKP
jgi:hypothetical protein